VLNRHFKKGKNRTRWLPFSERFRWITRLARMENLSDREDLLLLAAALRARVMPVTLTKEAGHLKSAVVIPYLRQLSDSRLMGCFAGSPDYANSLLKCL
jgi:hypothetical protein